MSEEIKTESPVETIVSNEIIVPKQYKSNIPLVADAIRYCKEIKACEIYNIACLAAGEYRVMYWIVEDGKRVMRAKILPIPVV